jgi:hypothetical protein
MFRMARDWEDISATLSIKSLDQVESHGDIAHLYLYGWEIEAQNEWRKLECAIADAAHRKTLTRVTDRELFQVHKQRH